MPVILVRRVGTDYEYIIQQGNNVVNFVLDQTLHDVLKAAQDLADRVPENAGRNCVVIPLALAETETEVAALPLVIDRVKQK